MKEPLKNITRPSTVPLASKIEHRSEFYSGNMMINTGTLTIERIAYYTAGDNSEKAWRLAKEDTTNAILSEIYTEIRPCVKELLGELNEAPESKRRNRCLGLAKRIAEVAALPLSESTNRTPGLI